MCVAPFVAFFSSFGHKLASFVGSSGASSARASENSWKYALSCVLCSHRSAAVFWYAASRFVPSFRNLSSVAAVCDIENISLR